MQTFIDLLLTCNSPATYLPGQVNDASQKGGFHLVYDYQYIVFKRFENGWEGGWKWNGNVPEGDNGRHNVPDVGAG